MRSDTASPQEEETLALAAVARLGEANANEVARELGVGAIGHTLTRLEAQGRLVRVREGRSPISGAPIWKYRIAPGERIGARSAALP